MKVLAILMVAVSSAAARGSGPYLPSGWRPDGPAFFLPGEGAAKTSDNPLKETLFQETEASGSDFLREYGPPKVQEVSQDITQQGLPDVVTEQSFVVIGAKIGQEEARESVEEKETEAVVAEEQSKTVAEEEVTTEAQAIIEDKTTEQPIEELVQGRAINLEIEASVADTTDDFVEAAVVTESINSEAEAKVEENLQLNEKIQQGIASEVKSVAEVATDVEQNVKILEEVKNVAQELVKIESEVAQEQTVEGSGVRSIQITGSIEQAPEGFLEYGPPGFREYGPPKGDEVLRSSALQEKSESQLIENNETRRRRFSPKFKTTKKH